MPVYLRRSPQEEEISRLSRARTSLAAIERYTYRARTRLRVPPKPELPGLRAALSQRDAPWIASVFAVLAPII